MTCFWRVLIPFLLERSTQAKPQRNKVRNLYYVFLPKSKTVWNHIEPLEQFLDKLHAELSTKHANIKQVVYNPELVAEWLNKRDAIIKHVENNNSYSKNINRLCYWCQFKKYCESNGKDVSEIVIKDPVQSFQVNKQILSVICGYQ